MAETSTVGSLARDGTRRIEPVSSTHPECRSERDVVLVLAAAGRDRRRLRPRRAAVVVAVGVGRTAEELDAVGDDVDALAAGAVLRFPFAPRHAPVDRDRAALGEEAVAG